MSTWDQRKTTGDDHELRVAEELVMRGWKVDPWGQGVLSRQIRAVLRTTDSALRWTPDLIAARGEEVVLVDCKGRMTSLATNRHAVERAAVQAHLQYTAWTNLPVYYVFDDLGVMTAHDVLMAGKRGPRTRFGSGAPYYLVPSSAATSFDQVFGDPMVPVQTRLPLAA